MNEELLKKIIEKKEFSQLPKKDVELVFEKFENKELNDYQKLKLTRDLLRKIYSSFSSRKLLREVKGRDVEWFLNKHKSTKERLPFYGDIYKKIFLGVTEKEISVIDLGAGINGLSYNFFPKNLKIKYIGIEAVGQLVDLMNKFFLNEKINGKAIHESLFELEKIKKIIEKQKRPRIVFLFKVIDSLELIERNYSKKLLKEIAPLADRIAVSFATRSLGRRSEFSARRNWLINFVEENFNLVDDFEINGERYLVIEEK